MVHNPNKTNITWHGGLLLHLIRSYGHPRLGALHTVLMNASRHAFRHCEVCGGTENLMPALVRGRVARMQAGKPTVMPVEYRGWSCRECLWESGNDGSGT